MDVALTNITNLQLFYCWNFLSIQSTCTGGKKPVQLRKNEIFQVLIAYGDFSFQKRTLGFEIHTAAWAEAAEL